ncbi:MAG: 2-oxoacid:acceptor oxidoreductase family protein, partial [Candidatus Berkelbacteria bacterium]|nr:2-oxoacid:acceptor oxidoreductase family protein [Candidatus Berkelbacteria bacterium]
VCSSDLFVKSEATVSYIPQFGPEQRGTPSVSFLTISDSEISYPRFAAADFAIILRRRAIPTIKNFLSQKTKILFDSSTIPASAFSQKHSQLFGIPATKIAEEKFSSKVVNIIALGAVIRNFFSLDKNEVWLEVKNQLDKKFARNPELEKLNRDALSFGFDFSLERKKYSRAVFDTSKEILIRKNSQRVAQIIPSQCKGCGICIEKCPVSALKFGEVLGVFGTPVPEIDLEKCIACGNCFRFCPDSAIKVEKIK